MTSEQETAMYDQPEPRDTHANVSEPGKTDIPSAQMSLSGQIPTDDEREVIAQVILPAFAQLACAVYADGPYSEAESALEAVDLLIAAGFHRTVQGDPNQDREAQGLSEAEDYARDTEPSKRAETVDDFMTGWRTADRTRVQAEPSDAMVQAALEAYSTYREADGPGDAMRAALRAAAAVQGGETR